MRSKGVDEATLFQCLDTMDQIGWHNEAAALFQDFGATIDRHLEASFGDIACLDMRVEMSRTHGACLKGDLHHHHLGQIGHDTASHARFGVYPFGTFRRYEEIAR